MTKPFATRTCTVCGREYQPTAGQQKYCKECGPVVRAEKNRTRVDDPEYSRRYHEAHREEDNAAGRARHLNHKEEDAAVAKLWLAANRERKAAQVAAWEKKNPEKAHARQAKWRKTHPDYRTQWAKANPEKVARIAAKYSKGHLEICKLKSARRRARYANTPLDEMLTSTEWLEILAEANGHCHYCGRESKLTLDHVIPLSKGGKHSKENIVAACGHCNSSKGNRTLEEWRAKVQREVVSA